MRLSINGAAAAMLAMAVVMPAMAEEAVSGTLVPGAQLAQVPPPAPPPMMNWTGFYVGVNGGWVGSTRDRVNNTAQETAAGGLLTNLSVPGPFGPFGGHPNPVQFNLSYDGWQVGGTFGYNKQVAPQWVIGFEMDFDAGDANGTRTFAYPGGVLVPFTNTYKKSVGFLSTDRVRAGFLPTPSLMLFVSAGLAWGETEMRASFNCPTCAPPSATQATTTDNHHRWGAGLAWGGGAEWMFLPNWSLKAEYIRADLGTTSANLKYNYGPGGVPPLPSTSTQKTSAHFVDDIVRVGLNFHFAPPPPPPAPMAAPPPPPPPPPLIPGVRG